MPVLVRHEQGCSRRSAHSDAAKRVSDWYELHRAASPDGAIGRWIAVALADGSSDGVLYDGKRDAVCHQHHNEQFYAFVCIGPSAMSTCAAESFLAMNRAYYDKGLRLPDPDHRQGGREIITRVAIEDQRSLVRSIVRGGPASNLRYGR